MRGRLPINLLALAPEQRHKALQKATDNCFFYLRKNMFDECLFLVRYALELSRHLSAFRRKERESVCERRRNTAREVHTRARKRERARERERERDRMKERDMCIYIYIYIGGGDGYLMQDFRALFWPCRANGLPGFACRRWNEIGGGERVVGR